MLLVGRETEPARRQARRSTTRPLAAARHVVIARQGARAGRVAAAAISAALVGSVLAGPVVARPAALAAVLPAPELALRFSTQPLGATIGGPVAQGAPGVPWSIQPVVIATSDGVKPDTTASGTIYLDIDPSSPDTGGPGRLRCANDNGAELASGRATFAGCSIDVTGTGYILRATGSVTGGGGPDPVPAVESPDGQLPVPDPLQVLSLPFDIGGTGPIGEDLEFTTQPLGANVGGPVPSAPSGTIWRVQPVVAVVDGQGHPIPTAIGTVQLSITEGTPQSGRGSLGCTSGMTLALAGGVVRFSGCSITGAGRGYQLTARLLDGGDVGEVGGIGGPADTSLPFDITGGRVASSVGFSTQPLGAILGGAAPSAPTGTSWTVNPAVTVYDTTGRPVVTDFQTQVTIRMNGPAIGGLAVGGPASGGAGGFSCASGASVTVHAGVARFYGCQVIGAGSGYQLVASATSPIGPSLRGDVSLAFDITADPSSLTLQPSTLTVRAGGSLTLTARLLGAEAAGQTVTFKRQQAGDSGLITIGTGITSASGIAVITVVPQRTAVYQASFPGSGSLAAATSESDQVAVTSTVTLSPRGPVTLKEKIRKVTFRASVGPDVPGVTASMTFVVYRQVDGVYRYVDARKVAEGDHGVAAFAYIFKGTGKWYVFARYSGTAYYAQADSRKTFVTVP